MRSQEDLPWKSIDEPARAMGMDRPRPFFLEIPHCIKGHNQPKVLFSRLLGPTPEFLLVSASEEGEPGNLHF